MDLIDKWIEWNEKKIISHDFCMAFEAVFRKEIRQRIKQKRTLKMKIQREMVRPTDQEELKEWVRNNMMEEKPVV